MRSLLVRLLVSSQVLVVASAASAQQPQQLDAGVDAGPRRPVRRPDGPCVASLEDNPPNIRSAPPPPRRRQPRLVVVPPDPNHIRDTNMEAVQRAQASERAFLQALPRALRGLERCYGALLRTDPTLEAGAAVTLNVSETGAVGFDDDDMHLSNEALRACLDEMRQQVRVSPRFQGMLVPVVLGFCPRDRAVCFAGIVSYGANGGFDAPTDTMRALETHVRARMPLIEARYRALARRRREVVGPLRVFVTVGANGRTSGLGLAGNAFGAEDAVHAAMELFEPVTGACIVPAPAARMSLAAAVVLSRP